MSQEQAKDSTSSREQNGERILTAWDRMCAALQQDSLYVGSTAPGQVQSFLAKQRQSFLDKRVPLSSRENT